MVVNVKVVVVLLVLLVGVGFVSSADSSGMLQIWRNSSTGVNVSSVDNNGNWNILGNVDFSGVVSGNGSGLFGLDFSSINSSKWLENGTSLYYNSGNVGIGIGGPSYKLDVAGSVNIPGSEAYKISGFDFVKFFEAKNTVAIGKSAGSDVTQSVAVGVSAGDSSSGTFQTAVGYSAGYQNTGSRQAAIGNQAGGKNKGGYQSTLGNYAGYQNTGLFQTAMGSQAGYNNKADYNTAFGVWAGYNNLGAHQAAVGTYAGADNSGVNQVAFGSYAGQENVGANVVAIGYENLKNNSGHNVVAIGYQAGKDNSVSNQFIVAQANVNSVPLIQGDFATGILNVSGDVCSSGVCLSDVSSGNTNASNSDTLDSYDSSFFMPLNKSVYGDFDFNGGWTGGGASIIDGAIYAQSGYFYDINSLQVNNLDVNGSLVPDLDSQFDLGSGSMKWRDGYFSGTVNAASFVGDGSQLSGLEGNWNVSGGNMYPKDLGLKVGVGTNNPRGVFEIKGGLTAPVSSTFTTTAANSNLVMGRSNSGTTLMAGVGGSAYTWIQAQSSSDNTFRKLALNPRGGDVGIGTDSPGAELDVNGDAIVGGKMTVGNSEISTLANGDVNVW